MKSDRQTRLTDQTKANSQIRQTKTDQKDRHADRQTGIHTYRQTEKQTDQSDRLTESTGSSLTYVFLAVHRCACAKRTCLFCVAPENMLLCKAARPGGERLSSELRITKMRITKMN